MDSKKIREERKQEPGTWFLIPYVVCLFTTRVAEGDWSNQNEQPAKENVKRKKGLAIGKIMCAWRKKHVFLFVAECCVIQYSGYFLLLFSKSLNF